MYEHLVICIIADLFIEKLNLLMNDVSNTSCPRQDSPPQNCGDLFCGDGETAITLFDPYRISTPCG